MKVFLRHLRLGFTPSLVWLMSRSWRDSLSTWFQSLRRLLFPPFTSLPTHDDNDLQACTEFDIRQLAIQYDVLHLDYCWELDAVEPPRANPQSDYLLDKLRDVTQMKNRMETEQKDLKAQIAAAYEQGHLAHLVDEKNSQRYNGSGVSVTLVNRTPEKRWEPEVQSEIDKLQAEIKRVEFIAERRRQYREAPGVLLDGDAGQEILIRINGLPAPQGSKRHVGGGIMVESSKRAKPWRQDVMHQARDQYRGSTSDWSRFC